MVNNYLRDIKVKDVKEYEKELYLNLHPIIRIFFLQFRGESKGYIKRKLDQALQKFTEKFIQSRS